MFSLLGGSFAFLGYTMIRSIVLKEAQNHVESALRVAWSEYFHKLDDITRILQLIGGKSVLLQALKQKDAASITPRLEILMKQYGLDFITVLDQKGRVFTRARYPYHRDDQAYMDGVILGALRGKETKGTVVIPCEALDAEGDGLVRKVFLELVATPKAKLTPFKFIDSGLVLKAGIPIWDGNEQIGLVYGGILLNRNYEVVDRIEQTVFQKDKYNGRRLGTVTVFQWDTRITTTVRNGDGTRAIGTRVSSEVQNRVLENGLPWYGKAFVVRDWYLSAYEPILSPEKDIVGIIYVGVLEKKFIDYQKSLLAQFLLTAGLGILGVFIISYLLFSSFVRPINRLARATEEVAEGQFPSNIPEEKVYREVHACTQAFNVMVQNIRERDEKLHKMNADLSYINEELKSQNRNYMEILGFVAHEIKSPINSITYGLSAMTNQAIGELNDKQQELSKIIFRNAEYLTTMIRNYLDLSRIEKGELMVDVSNVLFEEEVIQPLKVQLTAQLEALEMSIVDTVPVGLAMECDRDLMKVVMNNLISNAIKYGRPHTEIKILFHDQGDVVQVGVWNEGQGISAADSEKLFKKFSTLASKDRMGKKGTGLGLFITREIIERHGGTVWVGSEEGKWVQFNFRIPKRIKSG
jgi:two-component system NtrC family sensor kinase